MLLAVLAMAGCGSIGPGAVTRDRLAICPRGWARPLGLAVVLVNLALIALPLLGGEAPGRALLWALAPVIIAGHPLAPAGRRALGAGQT